MTVFGLSPEDRAVIVRAAEGGAFDDLFASWLSSLGDEEKFEKLLAERASTILGAPVPVAKGASVWIDRIDGSSAEDPAWAVMGKRWGAP